MTATQSEAGSDWNRNLGKTIRNPTDRAATADVGMISFLRLIG